MGLGHLTAFAASDLRYVLYAGRDASGAETFGGHAILATSTSADGQRDAHGYIRGPQETKSSPASQASGSQDLPELVRDWMPPVGHAGSVVAILGYSPTGGTDRFEQGVKAAAAKSFVVAIHEGHLSVSCVVNGQ